MNNSIDKMIDFFRETIREISDDSVFEDEYLFDLLMMARAKIIDQELSNNKDLNPWLYQRFCVKLCPSNFIECSCAPFDFGCKVWKSEKPIPEALMSNGNLVFTASHLWTEPRYGTQNGIINRVNERSYKYSVYRKHKEDFYFYIGDYNGQKYLFILGNKIPPRYIKIEGVFTDPTEIEYLACADDECPNPLGTGFPLDKKNQFDLIKLSLDMITLPKQQPEDRSNNAESVQTERKI